MFEGEQPFIAKNKNAVEREITNWEAPDSIVKPDHPRFHEYEHIRNNVINILTHMKVHLTMPGGDPGFLAAAECLRDMYKAAENIRSQMASDKIRADMGVQPNEDYDTVVEDRVVKATEDIGMYGEDINETLTAIATGLGKNAADVRDGDTYGNYFFYESGKAVGMVDFSKVRKAEKYVQDLQKMNKSLSPTTIALAAQLEKGIQSIREIDQVRNNGDKAWDALMAAKGSMSSVPIRALGVVVGGLITAFGLGRNAYQIWKGETPEINIATFGWAGILLYSLYPDMFQTSPERAFAALKSDRKEERIAMEKGFRGPKGVDALVEIQELASSEDSGLKALSKKDEVTMSDIGAIAAGNTALIEILGSMKTDKDRAHAIRTFASKKDEAEIELYKKLLLS
jgi:hypothetical protein